MESSHRPPPRPVLASFCAESSSLPFSPLNPPLPLPSPLLSFPPILYQPLPSAPLPSLPSPGKGASLISCSGCHCPSVSAAGLGHCYPISRTLFLRVISLCFHLNGIQKQHAHRGKTILSGTVTNSL